MLMKHLLIYLRNFSLFFLCFYTCLFPMAHSDTDKNRPIEIPEFSRKLINFTEATTYMADVQAYPFVRQEVVLYEKFPDVWCFAVIIKIYQMSDTARLFDLFIFNSGTYASVEEQKLRHIAPLWSCVCHPYVGLEVLADLLDQYLQKFPEKGTPYIKTIPVFAGNSFLITSDIHGYMLSLSNILRDWYDRNFIDKNLILQAGCSAVGLGDYEDRGKSGVEVWKVLLMLEKQNPGHVYLGRGNHEENQYGQGTFVWEWMSKFGPNGGAQSWAKLQSLFQKLPSILTLVSKTNDQQLKKDIYRFFFCCHGGVPLETKLTELMVKHVVENPREGVAVPVDAVTDYHIRWTDYCAATKKEAQEDVALRGMKSDRNRVFNDLNVPAVVNFFKDQEFTRNSTTWVCSPCSTVRGHGHIPGVSLLRKFREIEEGQPETPLQKMHNTWETLDDEKEHMMEHADVYTVTSSHNVSGEGSLDSYAVLHVEQDGRMSIMPVYVNNNEIARLTSSY